MWSAYNGCTGALVADEARFDVDKDLAGDDTSVARHDCCPTGIDAELWTIEDGAHVPAPQHDFPDMIWTWLADHLRP
jgi:hypothetical protein